MLENLKIIPKNGIESKNLWIINIDGYYIKCVVNEMKKENYSNESINTIIQNGAYILSNCPNPNNKKDKPKKTGIVIGKIQSGKTSNFISLIGLAFDNEYEIAIVLGGNKKNLLEQNVERIKFFFNIEDDKLVILNTQDNSNIINSKTISEFIKQKRKIIIIGLKHQKHINKISNIFNNSELKFTPTIIIDDEGDQGTLNTKKYTKIESELSKIYQAVIDLKNKIEKHCFISITATPQANILIDKLDILSPDFGVLVHPGKGYCGLAEFHGNKQDKYIKVIPEEEPSLLDSYVIPNSVNKALALFFVSNGIRKYRGDFNKHAILFHPSNKTDDHQSVVNKLQVVIDDWKIKSENYNDIAYVSLQKELILAYESYKKDNVDLPNFIDLEKFILDSIKFCSNVHLINSHNDATKNSEFYKTNIFVGGNMVERGLTIKGLAVTYIIRRAKQKSNIDNTEQRARWFGYKKDYIDICRVYTTQQIKDDFHNIFEHDEALWDTIEKAEKQSIPFKEITRVFKTNSKLKLTRSNVAKTQNLDFDQFNSQNFIVLNKEVANKNNKILEKFKKDNEKKIVFKKYSKYQEHLLLPNLNFSLVKKEIFDLYEFPEKCNLNKKFFNLLEVGFQYLKIDPITDVIWVRYNTKEERNIDETGKIISTLMQGHNPNFDSNNFYIGDRKLSDERPNNIQVQVHLVKPNKIKNHDFYSPSFVIYLPLSLTELLLPFVTRKGEK